MSGISTDVFGMSFRTTRVLDEATREAARQLARHSEAIRRAVLSQRDAVVGVSPELRRHSDAVIQVSAVAWSEELALVAAARRHTQKMC